MSDEVKRFSYGYTDDINGNRYLGLTENPNGTLVKASDYGALAAECERLRAELESLKTQEPVAWESWHDEDGQPWDFPPILTKSFSEVQRTPLFGWKPLYACPVVTEVEYGDAYQGAREDLSIWKRRAMEAEEKVRQVCGDQTHMGEPVISGDVLCDRKAMERLFRALGCSGAVTNTKLVNLAANKLESAARREQSERAVVMPKRKVSSWDMPMGPQYDEQVEHGTKLYAQPQTADQVALPRPLLQSLLDLWRIKGNGRKGSPNHSHSVEGVWDQGNRAEIAGKPCAECALYDAVRERLEGQPAEVKS